MADYWMDWASLLLRWLHVITAIAWIGSSFYFVWLDLSLRKREGLTEGVHGESWSVHGGGFYHVQKYLVAPAQMPPELHWFKYESYVTWISGFSLLVVTYYWGASAYLIDHGVAVWSPLQAIGLSLLGLILGWLVYDGLCRSPVGRHLPTLAITVFVLILLASWLFSQAFSSRAALLHVGAMVATWMTANVFFIIIPNQKKVVRSLEAGEAPDPALGQQAKQRSTHNNYLTLPVLFMMLSNHYPMTFVGEQLWILVALVVLIGGIVRDYFNASHAGGHGWRIRWQWPAASVLTILLAVWAMPPSLTNATADTVVTDAEALQLVTTHCAGCHAAQPTQLGFTTAPKGVILETLEEIDRYRAQIYSQSVASQAMPLGNMTQMTQAERARLGAWIQAQ
ncbi:MAG: cysteine desulfurase [Gammaproteobacteria bacterium]|nr:cysteine desulfurase [Gammaproteobacteria bacterium]